MTTALTPADTSQPNDRGAIERFTAEWNAAMKAKDVVRLMSMVTEDVVFLPPGFPPIRGRQAVEAMYRSFFPQFSSIEQEAVSEEIEMMGTGPSRGAGKASCWFPRAMARRFAWTERG